MTEFGPVDVQVVAFEGSNFNGSIAPALADVLAAGFINIVDFAFVTKTLDGDVAVLEVDDLGLDEVGVLSDAVEDILNLLNEEDLLLIGEMLTPGSSAVAIVIEHAWARGVASAVADAGGSVIMAERIPREIVQAAVEAAQA